MKGTQATNKAPHKSNPAKTRTPVSRRHFLGKSAGAALAFSIVPRHLLGGPGFVPPSDKVNIAFIGVGAQGLRVMLHFLKEPDVQGVAVCDVNKASADYPQWDTHEFSKSVRSLLGVDSGWDWLSPDQPIQLSHTLKVTSGVAGREPSQQIVNALYASRKSSGKYNGCAAYSDYRELLEKQKDVDAVVVCTTDHLRGGDEKTQTRLLPEAPHSHDFRSAADRGDRPPDRSGHADRRRQPSLGSHTFAMRMDLGWRDWSRAPSTQLVFASFLAARRRAPQGNAAGA